MTQHEELGSSDEARSEPGSSSDARELSVCPYLLAAGGAWRASTPAREHQCTAVAPAAPLSIQKQARLCLTSGHGTCATYLAAIGARDVRGLPAHGAAAARWDFVRTTPVVEARAGLVASISGLASERRGWQALPALVLVLALAAVGVAGWGRGAESAAPSATAPSIAASSATPPPPIATIPPTASPSATPRPTEPTPTPTPSPPTEPTPSPSPSSSPEPSVRAIYTVKAGDTLYGIAGQFGTTVNAIKTLNGLSSNTIRVGIVLRIP